MPLSTLPPTIFAKTGVATSSAFLQSVIVGVVNVGFTFVAIGLIDKMGRKPLLLAGSAGMAISLGVLVWAFATGNVHGLIVLFSGPWIHCFICSLTGSGYVGSNLRNLS